MFFDLLKLHDNNTDKNMQGSWIKANGPVLNKEIKELLHCLYRKRNQNNFAKLLCSLLNCSFSTAKRHLININKGRPWVALKIISSLLDIWKDLYTVNERDFKNKKWRIIKGIQFLKVGQQQSKPVKVPKFLTLTLCKINGAHAADGTLSSDYRLS